MYNTHQTWNPVCKVIFAGFKSSTLELQQAGWEIAAEQDPFKGVRLALHHRKSGLQALTNTVPMLELRAAVTKSAGYDIIKHITFQVVHVGTDTRFQIIPMVGPVSFKAIDATPEWSEVKSSEISFHDLIPFRTVNPDAEQIIVAPDSVPQILDLLLKCQAPVQRRIRQNERVRSAADVAAQIVTAVA
jgi:hypothetical protein